MNHQEWFERFKINLGFDEDGFVRQMEFLDEWKGLRTAFIKMALYTLPPLQRKIINYLCFKGVSEREIARLLGLSKSSVNREKWKALGHLRHQFLMQFVARKV